MKYKSLDGMWDVILKDGSQWRMSVPGTLDENKIGYSDIGTNQWHPDDGLGSSDERFEASQGIATRFTRKYTYEGPAEIARTVTVEYEEDFRVFVEVERARCPKLEIDGREIPPYEEQSISTPHIFEITGIAVGEHEIKFISDNSYPGLPYGNIVYSSAATDETQTNWNGLLGYIRLRRERQTFIAALRVYPEKNYLRAVLEIDSAEGYRGNVFLNSSVLEEQYKMEVDLQAGKQEIVLENLKLKKDVMFWDEYEGNLYEITAGLSGGDSRTELFGLRVFGDDGNGRLALNGRPIFLRSEANCAEFPEKGYCPMTEEEWTDILEKYKRYGVNCVRFHSHCPPEAAFSAADRIGMMMQPELSHWNPRDAFLSEESYSYYKTELRQIIKMLANHPSFVMLTLGNELATDASGHERMDELTELGGRLDNTRLYSRASNEHYGAVGPSMKSDFYTAQKYKEYDLRGTFAAERDRPGGIQGYINHKYPDAKSNYDEGMTQLRKVYKKPVFNFEVGQFEVLPDFSELEQFRGISDPVNYKLIRDKVKKRGLETVWDRYVEATGELARICYREEVEAVMRTESMSGISLLGIQDFPGQGTALVGMMNSHLCPKPYPFAQPERFQAFFRAQLPLVQLEKYTYVNGEVLCAEIIVANYGKSSISGLLEYSLHGVYHNVYGSLGEVNCPYGKNTYAGSLKIELNGFERAERLVLTVNIGGVLNTYPIWVYPDIVPECPVEIYETRNLDEAAVQVLEEGRNVYLSPDSDKEHLPHSIQAQFTTDFWSVGTFAAQEGGMGQLIDEDHPIFENFPTEFHTNWQWWPMAVQRAIILPEDMKCIITEMDSYAFLRPMAQLLECRCGNGKLLISSMGLHNLQQYPEARALQDAIYKYMVSEKFAPEQEMLPETVKSIII